MQIGILSDTHGPLRPEALDALKGADLIMHAGDIGDPGVLDELRSIAPIHAVRGNVDGGAWALSLPEERTISAGGVRLHLIHNRHDLSIDPVAQKIAAVISGHTHRPVVQRTEHVLWINPGSAGPRRFSLPVTIAILRIEEGRLEASILPVLS